MPVFSHAILHGLRSSNELTGDFIRQVCRARSRVEMTVEMMASAPSVMLCYHAPHFVTCGIHLTEGRTTLCPAGVCPCSGFGPIG
jgi:hypothetical protein